MSTDELQERIRRIDAETLAKRIHAARTAARENGSRTKLVRLSHDRLVERMGMSSRQHLIKLEQGTHRPSARTLTALSEATGYPVEWFLADDACPFHGRSMK
jgi:transcriptional regulator with XRE-family HTH domain